MPRDTPEDGSQAADGRSASRPSRSDDGWGVLSYLLTGVFLWGGIGWMLDSRLGTSFLTPVGLVVGFGLAIYLVSVRFGRP